MGLNLLLVGCGKMGGALLDGWCAAGLADRIDVVEPADTGPTHRGVHRVAGQEDLPADISPDIVVLAVKPQAMDDVVPTYRRLVRPTTAFLSIAAGKTIDYLRDGLGGAAAVVRAMPNTPAAIGKGMSVLVAGPDVMAVQRDACDRLMAAVGAVEWVDDEALLDAVTALSGGGPAYVFLLIEAMAAAGVAAGLPAATAMRLARTTVVGAGALAEASPQPAEILRRNVTSPGGTTAAALSILMSKDGLQPMFEKAIAAATARSRELAG